VCQPGFEKSDDGSHCLDVDECKNKNLQGGDMGTCTHLCTNSVGGYQCHCGLGWTQIFDGDTFAPSCTRLKCPPGTKGDPHWPDCEYVKKKKGK